MIVFRSAEWDTPWWDRPNRGAGRFNFAGSDPTQYLSEHPLTVFAERLRGLGPGVTADLDTIRWRCWAMHVDPAVLREVTFDSAPSVGLSADELVGDDWTPCQDLADRCRAAGEQGLIVPSAALPGTRNLVQFGARAASPYLHPAIDPVVDSPTAHVAEASQPPVELVPLVRWQGAPHAELEAWRSGASFTFVDPTPPRP